MRIYLVGMMGSGKSTIAKLLAKYLQYPTLDSDDAIENKLTLTINDIFKQYGESYFREQEYYILQESQKEDTLIFSTGGGVVEKKESCDILREEFVIFLKGDKQCLWQRVQKSNTRPLAQDEDVFYQRYQKRHALYEEVATATVEIDEKNNKEIIAEILFLIASQKIGE